MNVVQRIAGKWAALRVERGLRWSDGSYHCVVCGVAFGPDNECYCDKEEGSA